MQQASVFEVVTVTNGELGPLAHTIASALAQQGAAFTYTIIHGGAASLRGRLPQQVLEDPRVRLVEQRDRSLWDGMNNAIDAACGDWLLFLNAGDMFANSRSLQSMQAAVAEFAVWDVHYFDWCTFVRADDGRLTRLRRRKPEPIPMLEYKLPFCHQAAWVRTTLLRRHRFMPARAGQTQALDHAFFLRARRAGATFQHHAIMSTMYAAGGLSDTRRLDALIGNAWNTARIGGNPALAIICLARQTAVQTVALIPRSWRALRPVWDRVRRMAGVAVEAAFWGRFSRSSRRDVEASNRSGAVADALAVLVQYDPFAASVAQWATRSALLGQHVATVVSARYGHAADARSGRHLIAEHYLSAKQVLMAAKRAFRLTGDNSTLGRRARAQVNASVIRRFPGRLGHQIPFYAFHCGRSLMTFMLMREIAAQLFRTTTVRRILINDLSYAHNYAFIDAAFEAGISVSYYSTGFRSDQIYMRTVRAESELIHAVTAPSTQTARPRLPMHAARPVLADYYKRAMSGDTYAGARGGWGGRASNQGADDLRGHFGTDKPIIVIFSHVLFDANGAYGIDLFGSMECWLRETLMWYRDFGDGSCFVVVKEHPANKFKVESVDGVRPPCAERLIFDELGLEAFPDRFGFLADEQAIPTSELLRHAAGCITVRGSVAVEAAVHGVPVLVAGSSRFSGWGFVNEPGSTLEYFIELNRFFALSSRARSRTVIRATRYAERTLYSGGMSTAPWHITHEVGANARLVEHAEPAAATA